MELTQRTRGRGLAEGNGRDLAHFLTSLLTPACFSRIFYILYIFYTDSRAIFLKCTFDQVATLLITNPSVPPEHILMFPPTLISWQSFPSTSIFIFLLCCLLGFRHNKQPMVFHVPQIWSLVRTMLFSPYKPRSYLQ